MTKESKFGGKGTKAVIVALLKSNAKKRDMPALKLKHYAVLGVVEAVLVPTNNLIINFFPQACTL